MRCGFWAAVLTVSLLSVPSSFATDINFSDWTGGYAPWIYESGKSASQDFEYRIHYGLPNNNLSVSLHEHDRAATVTGEFSGEIRDLQGNILGTSTGVLDMVFNDLEFHPDNYDNIYAVGFQGTSTSSGTFSFQMHFDNAPLEAETIDVYGGFANPAADNGDYGYLNGSPFNFLFEREGDEFDFDIWVKSLPGQQFTVSNTPLNFHGDIHGRTAVPEPGSMILLGSAALGLAARRKRQKA